MKINIHDVRVSDRLRDLDSDFVETLKQSIAEIGLSTPITVAQDLTLIAGHHRLAACKALGMKEIEAHVLRLDDLRQELAEIDENLIRNELSVLERGEHLARRKEIYEALHPETKEGVAGGKAGGRGRPKIADPDPGSAITPSFIDDTAAKTGRSRSVVSEEIKIVNSIPAPVREQLRGTESANSKADLLAIASMDNESQGEVVRKLDTGEARTAREAISQIRRAEKRVVTLEEIVKDRFPVIYADPPWEYGNTGLKGSVAQQYPTMSTDEICAMKVGERATTNAVLFMWATWPLLKDALRVIEAWGFEYKTGAPWKKNVHVGGFYFLGITELLLVATRGAATPEKAPIGFFEYPRTKHSKKPHEFYQLIESMYPGPYLELFARNKRGGWTSFGNEPDLAEAG